MSANTGWIQTARRVLPKLLALSRHTAPTWRFDTIASIDPSLLTSNGIEAVLWDVDGTLMSHHADRVATALQSTFGALSGDPRFRHAIVSNCQLPRFGELGEMFPDIPVLLGFLTPDGPAFRVMQAGDETRFGPGVGRLPPPGSLKLGEDVSPMRKPAAELIEAALQHIGMAGRGDRAVMVGDQYFTDIASANLAGIRSIKVRTLDPSSFPAPVRLSQKLEGVWVGLLRATGLLTRKNG